MLLAALQSSTGVRPSSAGGSGLLSQRREQSPGPLLPSSSAEGGRRVLWLGHSSLLALSCCTLAPLRAPLLTAELRQEEWKERGQREQHSRGGEEPEPEPEPEPEALKEEEEEEEEEQEEGKSCAWSSPPPPQQAQMCAGQRKTESTPSSLARPGAEGRPATVPGCAWAQAGW